MDRWVTAFLLIAAATVLLLLEQWPLDNKAIESAVGLGFTLTFTADAKTVSGQVAQLNCQAGCHHALIRTAECSVVGMVHGDLPQWECRAKLPRGIVFSEVHVSCSGYWHSYDIIKATDSCALTYKLARVRSSDNSHPSRILSPAAWVVLGVSGLFVMAGLLLLLWWPTPLFPPGTKALRTPSGDESTPEEVILLVFIAFIMNLLCLGCRGGGRTTTRLAQTVRR